MIVVKFKCSDCGYRFDQPILTDREKEEAKRDRKPVVGVQCPKCGSPRFVRT
jgi:DNA-directed RNA polymerase subunit RPC12/RpoP